ncbi:flagellar biosynthesis protein FlgM [Escherichia coli]|uniref:flagellar biosynthesis protein FlgM n=1 Tax=Escherichia coli TaxID=562 RepID=UPI00181CD031|nr:flagellar biosynthesis protein FlgM [Escherichia coli]EEQ9398117.1 flagellar biosynthesis protein FlgM [Escherichia coli]EFF8876818.1 flagellar biosynthesis protein FlgM [Escherichia coli]EFI6374956.1 flagellar biosynthesis protein FlgM [Escherichia coli]EHU3874570.1 flagellar biosynthesis protein FlgM [Escherichia coli]EHW9001849.1 flagellar biosynthesis protein FlgM [Escherichia coli]
MAYHSPVFTLHYPYLRRMSWAQITAEAEDAEVHHDYARALILWQHAYHAATLTLNKNLARAKIHFCAERIQMCEKMSRIIRNTGTDEMLFCLSKHHHLYEKKKEG